MTQRQINAIQNMVENGGNMYRAMLDAGYSRAMAKNSHKLTKSSQVRQYLSEQGISAEMAISSLSYLLENGHTADKLLVAKFCLSSW